MSNEIKGSATNLNKNFRTNDDKYIIIKKIDEMVALVESINVAPHYRIVGGCKHVKNMNVFAVLNACNAKFKNEPDSLYCTDIDLSGCIVPPELDRLVWGVGKFVRKVSK